ncbi:MAG: hypothetical protein RLZZ519_851 [Bacteroidota bacterium]|jgi:hypothetical protein
MNAFDGKIIQIKEFGFEMNEFRPAVIADFDLNKLESFADFDFEVDRPKARMVIHCSVEVLYDTHFRALRFHAAFVFQFTELENLFDERDKIKKEILLEYITQSFLMASGMIAVKTQGFYLNQHPLPMPNQEFLVERVGKMIEAETQANPAS